MFCPNCGNEINDGIKFCTSCGTNLQEFNKPAEPVVEPAAPAVEPAAPVVEPAAPAQTGAYMTFGQMASSTPTVEPVAVTPVAEPAPVPTPVPVPVTPAAPAAPAQPAPYQQFDQNQGYAPQQPQQQYYAESVHPVNDNNTLITVCKIFLIIACVVNSLALFFIPLAWCLPMTIVLFKKFKTGEPIGVGLKICTLLFVSLISGVLLLVMKDTKEA